MSKLIIGVIVIGCLYVAQSVFVPIAMALFLACMLVPLVTTLEKLRLGRTLSVLSVVILAAALVAGLGTLVKGQITQLANKLPTHTENIQEKVQYLRQMGQGEGMRRLEEMSDAITGEWTKPVADAVEEAVNPPVSSTPETPENAPAEPAPEPAAPAPEPEPESESEVSDWLSRVTALIPSVMASLGGLALAFVLVVFTLIEREDLRNRLIRMMGNGRMIVTTKALDDAGSRISRYLFTQLAANSAYGVVWGLSLFIIGLDYALLWGFLSAIMRYIPFVGAPAAALLPIALSLAQFPGWRWPLIVIGTFLILELIWNNVVETLAFSHSIGVSAVALLVSAAFWAFMWGPVGLLLAGPMTVCLVVIGKHVPELAFFTVLLGDAPVLDPDDSFYQRLLARDQDEATRLALKLAETTSPEAVYDELLVPTLIRARRDRVANELTVADEEFVYQATHEIADDLGEQQRAAANVDAEEDAGAAAPVAEPMVLACLARDPGDRLALEMLQKILDPNHWRLEWASVETLIVKHHNQTATDTPAIICIAALPPGGLAYSRYICKRLSARRPDVKIVVGRYGLADNMEADRQAIQEAGADAMTTTLLETRERLNEWLPVPTREASIPIQDVPLISVTRAAS